MRIASGIRFLLVGLGLTLAGSSARSADPLTIATGGQTRAVVVVDAKAGPWEKRGAADLAEYVGRMTRAKPAVANAAPPPDVPALIVGAAALAADPTLKDALAKVAKKEPTLRADAIALRRKGNHVLLAGTNDDSHYYAAAELLRRW